MDLKRWNEHIFFVQLTVTRQLTEPLSSLHYAPVEGKPDAEEHYKSLAKAAANIPRHNVFL